MIERALQLFETLFAPQAGLRPIDLSIFVLGIAIIGLITEAFANLLGAEGSLAVAVILFVFAVVLLSVRNKPRPLTARISAGVDVPRCRYVISGLSPFSIMKNLPRSPANTEVIYRLLEHHAGTLERLYLIRTSGDSVDQAFQYVVERANEIDPKIEVIPLSIQNHELPDETRQRSVALFASLLKNPDTILNQMLVDVTAGTAAISVGLTLAALQFGCRITYQPKATGAPPFVSFKSDLVVVENLNRNLLDASA